MALWPVHTSNVSGNNAAVFGYYSFVNNLLPFRATAVVENGNKLSPFRETLLTFSTILLLVWTGL